MEKLNPEVLEWACQRSGISREQIEKSFPKYSQWLDGTKNPTVRQLRMFAEKMHVSVFDLFRGSIPNYELQIADFRTVKNRPTEEPSPELFDTIETMLSRQQWMREYFVREGYDEVPFIGLYENKPIESKTAVSLAKDIHQQLGLDNDWAKSCKNVNEALRLLKNRIESMRISVSINGVVGDNTHRKLDVEEFRGFALSDRFAPIIFINGQDAKSAQIFTLIHELCHLAFAKTGVSNISDGEVSTDKDFEPFCNAVAAEFLVPKEDFVPFWNTTEGTLSHKVTKGIRTYKVSSFVIAKRAKDLNLINNADFSELWRFYENELQHAQTQNTAGGDYFLTKQYKLGTVFSEAVFTAVQTDSLTYRDAYDLTDMKAPTFKKYFREVA